MPVLEDVWVAPTDEGDCGANAEDRVLLLVWEEL